MAVIEERINNNGGKSYRVKIRAKGQKPISKSFARKTDAQLWAKKTEAEIAEGRYFPERVGKSRTLADLIDRYLDLELPKRSKGQAKIAMHLAWWRKAYGYMLLSEITPARLSEARDRLMKSQTDGNWKEKRRKSPATVNRYMASMSHAFTVAVSEWEWLTINPMRRVRRPREAQARVRFLSDGERERLLEACRESENRYLYTVVVVALSTGARYSEIMNLRWRDIDLKRGVARLEQTKNKERRALPLTHHALTLLQELDAEVLPDDTAYVFARADGKAPMELRKHWYRAMENAGIDDFRFHDLRHSAASYLAMNGATLAEIAEVLGHKTLQMVKRYAHLSDQHVAGVVERMNRAIFTEPANDNQPLVARRKRSAE
ncbi:MAG: tyrosine-type recombinase/integrase [Rubrimonas sp.]